MQRDGLWEWEFIEIERELLAPIPPDDTADDIAYFRRCTSILGRKSQELVPAIVKLMRAQEPFGSWSSTDSHRTKFRCGGSEVHVGRPGIPIRFFDDTPWVRQLLLIPHISARGPNGAWVIRRGPEHPQRKALERKNAFYLTTSGKPDIIVYCDELRYWRPEAIELFETHEEAQDFATELADDDLEESDVSRASGGDLLALLSLADIVEIGGEQHALTHKGAAYLEMDKTGFEEVIAALPTTG